MNAIDPSVPNQLVQQKSDPARRGVTTGRVRRAGTRAYAEVEFGPHERKFIEADDLEPVLVANPSVADLLRDLTFGDEGDLARILTFHKISSQLTNVFYAMQASRTDFYAYQFKPVYKFIESANGRVLVTDEVGLGKTVEAGLIWLEARARSQARRLLVVCPSMLREKWKQELRFRFNVPAAVYDSRGVISLLDDFRREGDNFSCAAVCSLQTVRQESVRKALSEFDGGPHRFDLVVIDEAHHLRNVDTQSHRAGSLLSDLTESMVLLTATPIHLKNEDLFRLLSLLDADEYGNLALFERRLQANEPVVRAQNALRRSPPAVADARREVESLRGSAWFGESAMVDLALSRLTGLDTADHRGVVEAGRLLENLNLLSSSVSRTRKREVQEWRVIREPVVLGVEFGRHESDFYAAVTRAVRERVRASHGGSFAAFALMMPQRQMASCIPAMVEYYRNEAAAFGAPDVDALEEMGFSWEEDEEGGDGGRDAASDLKALVDAWDPDARDSKFEALAAGLDRHFAREPESKVIVFSYFKRTLSYLRRMLEGRGVMAAVIHGDVPMDERQAVIDDFRDGDRVRVLLSSEVGAEGIDLQFCRVVVNYDLPWNPMKVEQRIGRVDRLGQKAEKISVVNLAVHGTIEETILQRLYDRIGIFERSIGDLEPILGHEIQELTRDLLSQDLTSEQVDARVAQTQMAIENRRQHEAELEAQSSAFVGVSDFILERIGEARRLGRWITPEDLLSFVRDFFGSYYRGTRVAPGRPAEGLITISLSHDARNDLAAFCHSQSADAQTALSRAGEDPVVLALTADAAQGNPRVEFLSHFHPLIRWIVERHRGEKNPFFPTAAVDLSTDLVPPGVHLCAVEFWTFLAAKKRKEVQVAYAAVPLGGRGGAAAIPAELLVREVLSRGKAWEHAHEILDADAVVAAWGECNAMLDEERGAAFRAFREKTLALAQRRKAHLENFLARKEDTLLRTAATLEARGAPPGQIKAFRTRASNLRESVAEKVREIDAESETDDEFNELAAVVCRVRK